MDIQVQHDAFRTRRLAVRTPTFWKAARVVVDGAEVSGKRRQFEVEDDRGQRRTIAFKGVFLDPIPKLQVDNEPTIELVRPLRWFEWLWMGLPITLALAGGGLGALFGILAVHVNSHIFRSERGTTSKYLLSGTVSSAATLVFFVCVVALQLAIAKK